MFYLGRSYMLNKQTLNIYKIGSLAVLLGIFGLVGTSVFATVCSDKNIGLNDWNPHKYTCQNPSNATGLCGGDWTTDTTSSGCPSGLVCHRCLCEGSKVFQGGMCTDPAAPGNGIQCKGDLIPNAAWTDCISKPVAKTLQEECEDKNEPNTLWKWENNKCKSCDAPGVCCGVKLNTDVPFIGRCIRLWSTASTDDTTVVTDTTAFPRLMWGLTKILTTIILLACFGGILAWGVMIASSGWSSERAWTGKKIIKNVVIAIALLWTSGIILKLINPNFFW